MAKRICIITSAHPPEDVRIYQKQARSLRRAGYEVTVVNPSLTKTDDLGIEFISADIPAMGRMKRILTAPNKVYQVAKQVDADVYHMHDPELLGIGKKLSKKALTIFDSHEDTASQILSKDYIPKLMRRMISWGFGVREKYASKKFSAIITATDTISDVFVNKGCKKVVTVNNFPMLEEFLAPSPYENRENAICYIGGITRIRGINEIVASLDGVDYRFLLAGKFETAELENRVKALPGFAQTDYFGLISRKEVADILSRTRVGLVIFYAEPNHINALPNKMFEYMAMAIPVVYSNFDFWKTLAGNEQDGVCGIAVDPYDPAQIRKACEYIISHPEEAKQMGENGKRLVHEKYNWKNEEAKLLALYKELLGE
ncbi:MAG: glycosyltransferase family 4 protein [Clostridia bacterium]|nr:glycosyltransferase family 4 protein [Clostridia bacterium]